LHVAFLQLIYYQIILLNWDIVTQCGSKNVVLLNIILESHLIFNGDKKVLQMLIFVIVTSKQVCENIVKIKMCGCHSLQNFIITIKKCVFAWKNVISPFQRSKCSKLLIFLPKNVGSNILGLALDFWRHSLSNEQMQKILSI